MKTPNAFKNFIFVFIILSFGASAFAGAVGEGTEGGGGGRTRSSNPAPVNDIIDSIMLARQYGTFYLIDTYNVCVNNHMGSKAKCTLVSGGLEASLAKFQSTIVKIEKTRACAVRLPSGRTRSEEASADRATNTICFSLEKIKKRKHSEREIFVKMFSLYMHEFAHLQGYGVDEKAEADLRLFQDDFENQNYTELPEGLSDALMDVYAYLNGIMAGHDYMNQPLDMISLDLFQFPHVSQRHYGEELSVMTFEEQREMDELSLVISHETLPKATDWKKLQELARKIRARMKRANRVNEPDAAISISSDDHERSDEDQGRQILE